MKSFAVLATMLLIAGSLTATDKVRASASSELVGDFSGVCATTGTTVRFADWDHYLSPKETPQHSLDTKWGAPSNYTATGITSTPSGSATNLTNVPGSKNTNFYLAYPLTTGVDTRIVIPRLRYGDSVGTAINMQAKLFSITGGTASAVVDGGSTAQTSDITTSATGGYFAEIFDFPDTLLASNQRYEMRVYLWGPSTINGYDDFSIDYAPCLPAPPTIATITTTDTTLSIPFTAPSITGGSTISNYEYSIDNGASWITPSPSITSGPLSVTGLSTGQTVDVKMRTITTAGTSSASAAVQATTGVNAPAPQRGTTPQAKPIVTLVSPDSNTSVPRNRTVSLFGTHFDTVTEVFVGGKKVEMRKISAFQVDITIPSSMSGLVDLEIKSPLNNVLSPKHFNLRAVETSSARGSELSVAGFEHNSRKLTEAMKRKIDRWLKQNPSNSTLTCTGFTSLPRRSTDVVLSTERGKSVCNFAKRKKPDLEIVIRPGVEDPRPGLKIRRALLVLTP